MPEMKCSLTVRTGPHEGTVFELDKETVILGRDVTNDIVLSDAEVSRRHSRMTLSPQGYVLEDLGSTNGTFVNGERLTGPHLLDHGDQIGLSQKLVISYEVTVEDAAETVAVEPAAEAPAEMAATDPVIDTMAEKAGEPVAADVAKKAEEFEVIKPAAPVDKKRVGRWAVAGIGCAALTVVCGGFLWFMDANYDNILYAPLNALMRLLGFQ